MPVSGSIYPVSPGSSGETPKIPWALIPSDGLNSVIKNPPCTSGPIAPTFS